MGSQADLGSRPDPGFDPPEWIPMVLHLPVLTFSFKGGYADQWWGAHPESVGHGAQWWSACLVNVGPRLPSGVLALNLKIKIIECVG